MVKSMLWTNTFLHFLVSCLISTGAVSANEASVDCGARPIFESGPQPRIFNGQDSTLGAWPWLGRLISQRHCTTVLIDDQWAVTVASCRVGKNDSIAFGETEREGSSPYRQEVKIVRVYSHPTHISLVQNDISLLQLETPVAITDYVRPICINQLSNEWEAYSNCWIAGWGIINIHDGLPQNLQEGQSRVITPEQCQEQHAPFGLIIHESQLCGLSGGNGETRTCPGDSGAPMMCSNDGQRWYIVGLGIGGAYTCGINTSIFSRISNLTTYIEATTKRVADCSEPDLRCNDGAVCLLEGEMCDGEGQCPSGEDEMGCPVLMCANTTCLNGGTCIGDDEGYICLCSEGWTGTNCETVDCGNASISVPLGSSVNLSSPFYPDNYANRLSCQWTITVMEGYKVLVEFLDFDVEAGFDFLGINDTIFSGTEPPANFTSVSESLDIALSTDRVTATKGFLLKLSAIDVAGINECEWNPCENNGVCLDESDGYSCECEGLFSGRICHAPDSYCGEQDIMLGSDSFRNLTSFNYPGINIYQSSYTCKWVVTALPGRQVRVEFMDLKLVPSRGTLALNARVFTGFDTPQEDFVSDGNSLGIVYFTIGTPYSLGFHLVLSDYLPTDGDECASQPCQNGGLCYDNENGFTCKCRRGFTGKTCQTGLSRCGRNSFQCNNGRCTKASTVCDGRNHCGDESDELNCDCEFPCHNGRCIPQRYACDKNNNCGDWSDELRPNC